MSSAGIQFFSFHARRIPLTWQAFAVGEYRFPADQLHPACLCVIWSKCNRKSVLGYLASLWYANTHRNIWKQLEVHINSYSFICNFSADSLWVNYVITASDRDWSTSRWNFGTKWKMLFTRPSKCYSYNFFSNWNVNEIFFSSRQHGITWHCPFFIGTFAIRVRVKITFLLLF